MEDPGQPVNRDLLEGTGQSEESELQEESEECELQEESLNHELDLLLEDPCVDHELLSAAKWDVRKLVRGFGTVVCIAMCVVTWVTSAQILRDIDSSYRKPFFQAYFIHSFYAIPYVAWKLWIIFPGKFACNRAGEGTLTNFKHLAIATGVLALAFYVTGVFWYLSLPRTSLSANTAVYQSASAMVFIFSVPVLRERVSVLKVLSVGLTIAGVTLISVFTDDSSNSTTPSNYTLSLEDGKLVASTGMPIGYVYLAASIILYAMMEVGYKKFATKPDDPALVQNSVRGLGYMGVHTLLWMWPLLVLLHFTGLETFELPELETFKYLMVNICLGLVFHICFFGCISLSSPLVTTVGTVLVVPGSVLVDWLLHDYILPRQAILGILGILAGFFGLVFSECVNALCWQKSSTYLAAEPSTSGIINAKLKKRRRLFLQYII